VGRLAIPPGQRVQRLRQKAGTIQYSSGVTTPLQIPQTDYLTSIDVMSNQTLITGGTPPVVAGYGAFGPLANVQVKVNGNRTPFSMPGVHADQFNKLWDHDYGDQMTASPIVVSTTNQWKNHLRIPLTVDPVSELGSWYTGDTALNLTLSLTMAPVATVLSTVSSATIGGSWDIWVEKFSAPAPDQPGGWLNEISYYHEAILQGTYSLINGKLPIILPVDQDYLRILLCAYTGSNQDSTFAPANGLITGVDLVVNEKFHIIDTMDEQTLQFENLQIDDLAFGAGYYAIDFMRLTPSRRDILPTDLNVAKRLVLYITSTSTSNKLDIITESTTDSQFAEKWLQSAKASKQPAAAGV
jgi:hypothetical protein